MKFLIVVDMQKDFIYGALGTKEAQNIVKNVVKKIKQAIVEGWTIVLTRDTHYENYMETLEGKKLPVVHCIKDTDGWQIDREIMDVVKEAPFTTWEVINKDTFGYLDWKKTFASYGPVEEIQIIGLCTGICVASNALILRANYRNVPISVVKDCCACVTPESHEAALNTMSMCQIDIIDLTV